MKRSGLRAEAFCAALLGAILGGCTGRPIISKGAMYTVSQKFDYKVPCFAARSTFNNYKRLERAASWNRAAQRAFFAFQLDNATTFLRNGDRVTLVATSPDDAILKVKTAMGVVCYVENGGAGLGLTLF